MPAHPRQGHRWDDHRTVVDGILLRTRTGCPWRDLLPAGLGTGRPFTGGIAAGRWMGPGRRSWTGCAQDATRSRGLDWAISAGSTVVRAHQHAAGARRALPAELARR